MSKKKQEDLQKDGFNVKMAAEASISGLGSASSSSEFGMTTEDTKKYEESIESSKIVTIGSKLPEDGETKSIDLYYVHVKIYMIAIYKCIALGSHSPAM